jgi:hypothetical protein
MPTGGFVSASSSSFFSLILLMRCQKSENRAAASSRKGITSWKFCQSSISVQLKCIWRESIHLVSPKSALDQRLQQLLFWIKIVNVHPDSAGKFMQGLCGAGNQIDRKFYFILFYFIFQVLRCQGLIGVNACIFKPSTFVLWTPHKEHTESAIRLNHQTQLLLWHLYAIISVS